MPHDCPNIRADIKAESQADTEALAKRLGALLRPGDLIALSGDLGMGKSVFARAVLRSLGVQGAIPSPTFTLLQSYDLNPAHNQTAPDLVTVHHADLYRLSSPDEVIELGLDDLLISGAMLVEWPENGEGVLPPCSLQLSFQQGDREEARIIRAVASENRYKPLTQTLGFPLPPKDLE